MDRDAEPQGGKRWSATNYATTIFINLYMNSITIRNIKIAVKYRFRQKKISDAVCKVIKKYKIL